jgi:hypothetical protein
MLISELIRIDVTPNIATALKFMIEAGTFDIKGGNVTLSFDPAGNLKTIKKEVFVYNKG